MFSKHALIVPALLMTVGYSRGNDPVSKAEQDALENQQGQASLRYPIKLQATRLPNPVQIHARVISGGLPQGTAAFQELADLGVKTVISVDGAKPDTETAKSFGMRYVHLPHGYDGIPEQLIKELAKAVRDLAGPIYIHCHHGKHRSPAAASVACVAAGLIEPTEARAILELAGTSPKFRGLYQSVNQASRLNDAVLDELKVEYRESADVPPMAEAMVNIERTFNRIQEIGNAGWTPSVSDPNLEPAHQTLLLREYFAELIRTREAQQWPGPFLRMLRDSEREARRLETQLARWMPVDESESPPVGLGESVNRISVHCKNCHQRFRDTPLSEK